MRSQNLDYPLWKLYYMDQYSPWKFLYLFFSIEKSPRYFGYVTDFLIKIQIHYLGTEGKLVF